MNLKQIPISERPRERLENFGAGVLSMNELVAILLQSGSKSKSVIEVAGDFVESIETIDELSELTVQELTKIKGIGTSKACKLLAAIELGRRLSKEKPKTKYYISSPDEGAEFIKDDLMNLKQEHFVTVFLDTKNKVIAKKTIFIGGLDHATTHPREVYKLALKYSAAKIICFHNHPSGDPTPSLSDIRFTETLVEAGNLIKIKLVDHIIIGKDESVSLRSLGYM